MAGTQHQRWVSYAGNDAEGWKCLLLSRALKRAMTTRPFIVIVSDNVSRDMGRKLQDEVSQLLWINPVDYPDLPFRSLAKLKAQLIQVHKTVFLDCNVLPLKNCDELFHINGVEWVGQDEAGVGEKFASIVAKSRSLARNEQELITDIVVHKESGGSYNEGRNHEGLELKEIKYSLEIDVGSVHPTPLNGDNVTMICFVNGHPHEDIMKLSKRGELEEEVIKICLSLCPEIHPQQVVNGYGDYLASLPSWELNDSIAIVGMACRYPCANNIDEFWTLLEQGLEGIRKVPEGRWTKDNAFIRMDNMDNTEAGFLSCPVDMFDAKFFNTNAADMAYLDPQQRLSLRIVWEALEQAGIDPNSLKNSLTGVFGGWWRNDYKEMLQMLGIVDSDFLRGYMGNALGPLTARISHFFELIGPSYSTESGCSTSIAGVDMACDSLRKEACNLAITVGANLLLHPFSPSLMESVLAPDGRCKTYDESADGFGRAEGIGVLILKRFSNAVADGDRIWGLLRGSAIVQEGPSKSMGTPTVDVEAKAMQLALERSGIDPDDVEFLETHGTGTPVGDPIEIAAVAKAYAGQRRDRKTNLIIGSVKTNIGHTESVCGIASIQKTVLSMKHELIPKHLHLRKLNPEIDLESIPAVLPLEPIPWKRRKGGKPRIAGVNSFGITGAQAHIIVQEPPEYIVPHSFQFRDQRDLRILTFSAKTDDSFKALVQAYVKILEEREPCLRDIEFTMHTGRPHMNLRGIAIGASRDELLTQLDLGIKAKSVPNMPSNICFLFTGQGSQYYGMAQALYKESVVFRANFNWCDSILKNEYGIALKEALWSNEDTGLLKQSLYSQTSIFVIEFCLLRLWESWGIKPNAVMGHSLGEFAAAVAARMISPKDAIKLVVTRSKLINALPTSSMLVIAADLDQTQQLLETAFLNQKKWLDIAAINSPSQTVIAGATDLINEFKVYCNNNDVKTHILDSSHAFHSSLMDPMLKEYEEVAAQLKYKEADSKCVFISGVDGRPITEINSDYWVRHTRERVRFVESSIAAVREGLTMFLEVGPHPVLSALVAANVDEVADVTCIPSLRRKCEDWETILASLGKLYMLGVSVNWKNFHRFTGGTKVDLPGYHFEETPYWMAIKDEGCSPFHPLIGGFIPNPSDVKIFKSSVNVHRLPFLKDHALGDKIIFPCAGYVDMCLTAGYAATQCSEGSFIKPISGPLCIRSFAITTPVCLSEMQATEFQVVVSKSPVDGSNISTIYTKLYLDDGSFKWVQNAFATFSIAPPSQLSFDFSAILERCTELLPSAFDYDDLVEYGFNFGPSLRVLRESRKGQVEGVEEFLFQFETNETPEDHERFILHPWTLDPMLQAQIFSGKVLDKLGQNRKRLVVPVSIDSFVWWGEKAPTGYIYVKENLKGSPEAHLFSKDGKLVASMIGTEFMETTLSNILSLIDSQRNPYPVMSEITWKEKLGPEERRIPVEELMSISLKEKYYDPSQPYNQFTPEESDFYINCNRLAELYMLKAVKELNVQEYVQFGWNEMAEKIGAVTALKKFVRYILICLVEDGWFTFQEDAFFVPKKVIPEVPTILKEIDSHMAFMKSKGVGLIDLDLVEGIWSNLAKMITGKVQALHLLYPEDGTPGPAQLYYTESTFARKRFALNQVEGGILSHIGTLGNGKAVVRVLEIGAGVGSATSHLIPNMTEAGVSHYEYTYTDISPAFLQKGEQLFEETGIAAKFGLLNIENDPLSQGFIPGHYDLIVASWVLHATKSIESSLLNLKKLLRPGGIVLITELVHPCRSVNLLFGGFEGFWRFEDLHLRPWNCELSVPKWAEVMSRCGYTDIVGQSSYNGTNALITAKLGSVQGIASTIKDNNNRWIVFAGNSSVSDDIFNKLGQVTGEVICVTRKDVVDSGSEMESRIFEILRTTMASEEGKPSNSFQGIIYTWALDSEISTQAACEPFLYICKFVCKLQAPLKIVAVTRGSMCTGPSDFSLSVPVISPIVSMMNVLANENPDLVCKCVDLDLISTVGGEVIAEIFTPDVDVTIAYRNGQRYLPKLKPYRVKSSPLPIPKSPRFKLFLPQTHLIQDLKFGPWEPEAVGDGQVEIQVKAYALNFLDVFMVTKPDPVFEKYNYVGVDIAGVISAVGPNVLNRKVGDRVVVVRRSGEAMPSHLISSYKRTLHIPDDMTFAEAATYPMAVLTVASCLLDAAKAKPGEVVLIHTASGGVGLLGIQIAKQLGCEVVVTAGNDRKRNYLRHQMGLKYVFNSRTTDYEHDIRKALGGRGVDIVLNSLTGPGFKEATLSLCEKGARFIEMSKMNIWTNEDVKKLRPDVYYEVVDVSAVPEDVVQDLTDYLEKQLMAHIDERPQPLPFTRFDASEIREALEYMEKVKHIGKIVLMMPEQTKNGDYVFPLFNERSTYMITGGLGGIALEVAKWMESNGAKTLLLLGRSSVPKPEAAEKIEKLRALGVRVEIRSCDAGDMSQLEKIMEEFQSGALPPLRGIMHAAGLLDDAVYENQSWDKYENVFRPKINGAWNLHQISLRLNHPLEHFVVFSSMTGPLGSPGQSNYSAANYYLDQLVHYRNSHGLPGTTINWGQWGQVGMATNFVLHLHKSLTIHQGIAALEHIIKSQKTQMVVSDSDYATLKQVLNACKGLLADYEQDTSQGQNEIDGDEFWREYDSAPGRDEKYEVVHKFLKRLIRITLKMDKNEEIDDHVNFQDMGMDSLMMVEMKNGLQASVGKRVKISINAVKDCKTVAQLTERLVELISGKEELPAPTEDELKALVIKDATLPEKIKVDDQLKSTLVPLGTINTVLILGSTGMLGPYVVRELMHRSHIKKIYCLMQPNPLLSPSERFRKVYEKKGLLSEIDMDRIHCIHGDLKEKMFGMTDSTYAQLASEVDLIVNLAVKVSFEEIYRETDDPKSSRVVNVFGMRNVLSFSVDRKLKYVLHTSSFAAAAQIDPEGRLLEDWPKEEEVLLFPQTAYSISKLICDCQAREAVQRGIPCKVMRLPQIGGDSVHGGNVQLDSFLMTRCLAYLYTGYMHGSSIPLSLMAVDQCAKLVVELFFNEKAGMEMYHVLNPHMGDERNFESLASEFGISIKVLEADDFVEKWKKQSETSDEMVQLVKFAMSKDNELLGLRDRALPFYTSWNNGVKDIFWSKKLQRLMPDLYPNYITPSWDVLRKDLLYAKDSGVFDRYRIKYNVNNNN